MARNYSFFQTLPKNVFSGFVVSLIALPLGLGLAIACEAPPISGVISAIVGGMLVAVLGGSHVTIAGPGNGLVVILLSAITTLGAGDLQQGYLYTLAAIVVSGFLLILLGTLRMGILSDFFPSSAIQGMLAAIGIGIFAKQFHLMLGNITAKGTTLSLLYQIPQETYSYITQSNTSVLYAGLIGIVSLLIMFFYSKITNPILKLIPAPMWIVLLSIGLDYYYQFFSSATYPIDKSLLINIPENILNSLAFPDFTRVFENEFIAVVLSITLIASIESLLSIKAVDKLDPLKRRSNINKDLKALGFASVVSGFLGGLNVVTVIARSSVNVNNGATNKSANFFHALFLVLFLVLFQEQLRKIPLSALAAILVFTGYRLANPENIVKVFQIGKGQLVIFLTTLVVTLLTDLISGIFSGILVTFLIHILVNKKLTLFTSNVLRPNVLMYQESDRDNYYVSVLHFCSFLNFFKLKKNLDQIPEDQNAIIDFSRCCFVDHTVMENLQNYEATFANKSGNFEVVGLDLHHTHTAHPFAPRTIKYDTPQINTQNFTRRQRALKGVAKDFGWQYEVFNAQPLQFFKDTLYFKTNSIDTVKNILTHKNCTLCDVIYTKGVFIAKQWIRSTVLYIRTSQQVPDFTLDKEGFFEYITHVGDRQIHLKNHPDFSERFYLYGGDKKAISKFFSDELILFFESNAYYHIESMQKGLLIFKNQRLSSVREIKALIDFGLRLDQIINKK